jgi:hypothetical protein
MGEVAGVITVVQERRFKLARDDGGHELFVLAANAPVDADAVQRWQVAGARVRVTWRPASGLVARIAQDVRPIPPEEVSP